MKKALIFTVFLFIFSSLMNAQFPDEVIAVEAQPNTITEVKGDLGDGMKITDLSWASTSSNACWPATQNTKFNGNHVLYGFQIPPYSELTVKVIPDDPKANFSLYGYQVGTTNYAIPPKLASCVSCEADHKWDYPKRGQTQDHSRSVFFNSIKNPYNIFIGVVGAEMLEKGSYSLEIDLKSRVENTEAQGELKIYSAPSEKGKTVAYKGNLKDGCKIHDLSFAERSSVACFPGTQNTKFRGNHVFYVTEIPPHSEMDITVVPDDPKANFSLYAYQTGVTGKEFPPNVNSCVTCEADHKWDYPKRGKTQDHTRTVSLNAINNSYRVVIGVAGAEGLTDGSFIVKITTR